MSEPPDWNNVEEAFRDLDKNEFAFFARALAAYRKSLMDHGFTRREAYKLVESYSKFIYDMSIEEFLTRKALDADEEDLEDPDDVDEDEDEEVH